MERPEERFNTLEALFERLTPQTTWAISLCACSVACPALTGRPAAFAGGPYQVELVVFRQAGDAVPSSQPAPDDWATGAQPLASDALRATALDNQLAKLSQDNGYTVLLHKAWRQDIGETPVKIALSEGQEQDHHFPVEGTLTSARCASSTWRPISGSIASATTVSPAASTSGRARG